MKTPRILAATIAAFLLCPAALHATRYWIQPDGGTFNFNANWSATEGGAGGASVPVNSDPIFFTLSATYGVAFSSDVTNQSAIFSAGNVTFDLNGFTHTLANGGMFQPGEMNIGAAEGGTGRLTLREGTVAFTTSGDGVDLGRLDGGTGFLTVTTGGRVGDGVVRNRMNIGRGGTGTLTVNDTGRIDAGTFTAASEFGSVGTVTITGPNAVADVSGVTTLGDFGAATMTVSNGGTFASGSTVMLADEVGADGTVTVSGLGSSWTMASIATIGNAGDGALTISSGGVVTSNITVALGLATTGTGTATVTGANSRWEVSSTHTIGWSGLGVTTVSAGGEIASGGGVTLGLNAGSEGRATVTGAGSRWTTGGQMLVGSSGTADLTISAGGVVSTTNLTLGLQAAGVGIATVTGAGSKLTTSGVLTVASSGTGTLQVASGAEVYVGTDLLVNNPAGTPTGTLELDGGAIYVAGNFTNNNFFNFSDGLLQVTGNFQPSAAATSFRINGTDSGDLPTLDLIGTGTTSNASAIFVGDDRRGQLLLRQGRVVDLGAGSVNIGALVGSEGFMSVQSGAQFLTTGTIRVGGSGTTPGGVATLEISGGIVDISQLRIFQGGTVRLDGGTLAVETLPVLDGQFDWTGGTLRFDAATSLSSTNVPTLLGLDGTVRAGQALSSASSVALTLTTPIVVAGGTLSPGLLVNNSTLEVRSGSASVAGTTTNNAGALLFLERALSIGGTLTNASGARLELAGGTGRLLGAGAVQNNGLILGDGTISNAVTNNATGRIRVDTGKTLFFTGAFSANAGELQLQGGTLEFTGALTNSATGFISGRGALYAASITNSGQIAFSAGTTDVHGDVTNAAGGRIVTSGAVTTTFFDDVIHNGTEIRTSAGGASVFFGAVSGAGPFTGTGTVYFEGDLRPGNSPASVFYEGDLVFGGGASLTLEIGGLALGEEHDHLTIGGTLHADGLLVVALIGGYTPQLGDTFDLLDAATFTGDFDAITAPALPGDWGWDFTNLKTNGAVTVVPEPGVGALLLSALGLLGRRRRSRNSPNPSPTTNPS